MEHWSFSRSERFNRCRKCFFDNLRKKNKSISNRSNSKAISESKYIGQCIHETIKTVLTEQVNTYGKNVSDMPMYSWNDLLEHFEEISDSLYTVGKLSKKTDLDRTAKEHLKIWNKYFRNMYRNHQIISIEKPENWNFQGSKIELIVDLLTSENQQLHITDWKSNKIPKPRNNDPQLISYAIWAEEKYPNYDSVNCYFFYTRDGKKVVNEISKSKKDDMKKRISDEIIIWNEMKVENFPKSVSCKQCN